jgi:hypothetical protein
VYVLVARSVSGRWLGLSFGTVLSPDSLHRKTELEEEISKEICDKFAEYERKMNDSFEETKVILINILFFSGFFCSQNELLEELKVRINAINEKVFAHIDEHKEQYIRKNVDYKEVEEKLKELKERMSVLNGFFFFFFFFFYFILCGFWFAYDLDVIYFFIGFCDTFLFLHYFINLLSLSILPTAFHFSFLSYVYSFYTSLPFSLALRALLPASPCSALRLLLRRAQPAARRPRGARAGVHRRAAGRLRVLLRGRAVSAADGGGEEGRAGAWHRARHGDVRPGRGGARAGEGEDGEGVEEKEGKKGTKK